MEKTIIVNENDEIIGAKNRTDITKDDIYRVSALWLENGRGQTLLAQRSFTKKNDPGKWGAAVSGTLEEGETYDSNIRKEAFEELGLKDYEFKKRAYHRVSTFDNIYCQWYFLEADIPLMDFVIQENELEQIKWVDKGSLVNDWKENPDKYISSMELVLKEFIL